MTTGILIPGRNGVASPTKKILAYLRAEKDGIDGKVEVSRTNAVMVVTKFGQGEMDALRANYAQAEGTTPERVVVVSWSVLDD